MKKLKAVSCLFAFGLFPVTMLPATDAVPFVTLTRTDEEMRHLPTNLSVLTQKEIEATGAKTLDEVLQLIPSVSLNKTGTLGSFTTVRMRGVPNSAQTQLVIDDQPIGGVSIQNIDLSLIPTDNIERIEIVRGGASVLYGANTIGGVIHVRTKKKSSGQRAVNLGAETRSFGTEIARASAGGAAKNWDAYFAGSHFSTDGFQQNSDAKQWMGFGSVGYSHQSGAHLGVEVTGVNQKSGNPMGTTVPMDEWDGHKEKAAVSNTERIHQRSTQVRLKAAQPVSSHLMMQTVGYVSHLNYLIPRNANTPDGYDKTERIFGGDARLIWAEGLVLGGAYEWDGIRATDPFAPMANHISNYGFYAQDEWKLRALKIIPAVRLDHHSEFGEVTNPRLSMIYEANSQLALSGNAAKAFRAPSFQDLFYKSSYFEGNPNLGPEKAWSYDAGMSYRLMEGHQIKLTSFYTRLTDRITTDSTFTTVVNAPKAEIMGAECEIEGEAGPFVNRFNYTFQRARGNSVFSTSYVPLRLSPQHTFNDVLSWNGIKGWQVDNVFRFVSHQYKGDNQTGSRLPSFITWDARVARTISFAEMFIGVDNITNERYAESFSFSGINPQPGRTYWGGVNLRFSAS